MSASWLLLRLLCVASRLLSSLGALAWPFLCTHKALVSLPLLIRTPVLLDQVPTIKFPFSFNYLMTQMIRDLPTVQETWVQSLGWEDPLEEGMATHSSILAGRIPWTEEPGGLQSHRGCKELDTTKQLMHTHSYPFQGPVSNYTVTVRGLNFTI